MDEDPLMTACAVMEQVIAAQMQVKATRDPAIARLVNERGWSAPKASKQLVEEMLRRGYDVDDLKQAGIGPDNVRLIARIHREES
jgi:hypothetical protein